MGALALNAILLAPSPSYAAPADEFSTMIGRWSCVDRDSAGDALRFTTTNARYGMWLRLDATYLDKKGNAVGTAVTFLGYDANTRHWIISAVQSGGSYYTRSSSSKALNGSQWRDAYPADGATAVLDLVSSRRWVFRLSQPSSNSKPLNSTVTCEK